MTRPSRVNPFPLLLVSALAWLVFRLRCSWLVSLTGYLGSILLGVKVTPSPS
jgi:hypothetical protein